MMTDTSYLRKAETPKGKGYGLFTERRLEPGAVIFETEAVIQSTHNHKATIDPCDDLCAPNVRAQGFLRDCSAYLQRLRDTAKQEPHMPISEAQLKRILSSKLRTPFQRDFLEDSDEPETPEQVLANSAILIHTTGDVMRVANFYSTVMNHSCIPNAILDVSRYPPEPAKDFADLGGRRGRMQARALGHIKRGEEITISYREVFLYTNYTKKIFEDTELRGRCKCNSCTSESCRHWAQRSKLYYHIQLCWQHCYGPKLPYTDFVYDMCGLFSAAKSLKYSGYLLLDVLCNLIGRAYKAGDYFRLLTFVRRAFALGRQLLCSQHQRMEFLRTECLNVDLWLNSCIPGAGASEDLDFLTRPWLTGGGSDHCMPSFKGLGTHQERLSQASRKTID
jgi:hypothetical protein